MNRARALGKVAEIRRLAERGDEEAAHVAEDVLWLEVLTAIAEGSCEDPPEKLAAVAMRTVDINYVRWFA